MQPQMDVTLEILQHSSYGAGAWVGAWHKVQKLKPISSLGSNKQKTTSLSFPDLGTSLGELSWSEHLSGSIKKYKNVLMKNKNKAFHGSQVYYQ